MATLFAPTYHSSRHRTTSEVSPEVPKSCEPRKDILTGTFNPEIFTASLAEVTRFYQTNQAGVHSIVHVVGIAGNEIPVHKPKGIKLIPYTLWGEIAFQMGGEELYRLVEDDAEAYAEPGKNYYDSVFEGRKALVMIDEPAQYAARQTAAKADGSEQRN